MKHALTVSLLVLAAACAPAGGPGFATADTLAPSTFSAPGTVLTTATMHGKVTADAAIFPNLTVALVTVSATVAFTKVQNGAYSLVLPAQKEREDRNDKSPTFLHHESWELVLFNDRNNNGLYEPYLQGAKSKDKDSPLLTNEYYRLGYKGYLSNSASYNFLPLNAFERGWIVISRRGGQPNQHHQDFSRSYDITQYQ